MSNEDRIVRLRVFAPAMRVPAVIDCDSVILKVSLLTRGAYLEKNLFIIIPS